MLWQSSISLSSIHHISIIIIIMLTNPASFFSLHVHLMFCRALGISRFTKCLPSEAWLVTDCCGIVCAVFTYLLIFYAFFVVNRVMLASLTEYTNYKWINGILYNAMSFLAFSSHVRAMLSDPVSTMNITWISWLSSKLTFSRINFHTFYALVTLDSLIIW